MTQKIQALISIRGFFGTKPIIENLYTAVIYLLLSLLSWNYRDMPLPRLYRVTLRRAPYGRTSHRTVTDTHTDRFTGSRHGRLEVDTWQCRLDWQRSSAFFLAADGRTDKHGRPNLLQASLMASEFTEVIQFTSPPRAVQRVLFGVLAPIARMRGYRGTYPEWADRVSGYVDELEAIPVDIAALLPVAAAAGQQAGTPAR